MSRSRKDARKGRAFARPAPAAAAKRPGSAGAAKAGGRLAGVLAALVVASTILPNSSTVFAPSFIPRLAFFYPLAAVFVAYVLWTSARSGASGFRGDALDLVVLLLAVWIVLTAVLAPAPIVAWLGTYNRGNGAFFWIVCLGVFLAARRALFREGALDTFSVGVALLLIVEFGTVAAQTAGIQTPWNTNFIAQGRMNGTLGNPIMLAGAALCSVWLAGRLLLRSNGRGPWAWLVALGAVAGALTVVSTVSRAGYLAVVIAAVLIGSILVRRRSWRRVVVLLVAGAIVGLSTIAYSPAGGAQEAAAGALASRVVNEGVSAESDQDRVELWKTGLSALRERPVLGYGAGAFATVYRTHIASERLRQEPTTVVSDPHDLLVLIGSTMGVPGLALASAIFGLLVVAWWRSSRGSEERVATSLAGPAFVVAVGAFLLVSPLDLATAVPAALIAGGSSGGPSGRLHAHRIELGKRATQSILLGSVLALAVLAGVSAWQMADLWRADTYFREYFEAGDVPAARDAASLEPHWSVYSMVAGAGTWRQGVTDHDDKLTDMGESLLRSSLESDPYNVSARMELAKLYVVTRRNVQAADELRVALDANPHHPLVQGLLGYVAFMYATANGASDSQPAPGDKESAETLLAELVGMPVDSADGWYWISRTREVLGDKEGARIAEERAKAIDPTLTAQQYEDRISGR